MSESKGISLRRKKTTAARPIISGPIQQTPRDPSTDRNNSTYSSVADAKSTRSDATSRERLRLGGDQTSDLVKRRYSTRFTAGIPQDGPAPPMPAMPSMPSQYRSDAASQRSRSRPGPGGRGPSAPASGRTSPDKGGERGPSKLKIDMRALKDPNLQAEKYVQAILADATEQDIEAYQRDLQGVKAHTDADLQHNVFQNRTQFIKISKEADKLKTEMRTLRTLMSDLTGALGHAASAGGADFNTAASTLSLADRKRANRSSVANLEAMWSTHLQTLWKRVEGSQKYLPALPGRHIIMESQRWVELNAATWKPRRRVALVLLNDHLLVASEKKRPAEAAPQKNNRQSMYGGPQGSSQTTLVADRCWPLHDVSLADISTRASTTIGHSNSKENKAIANAINVRAGNESFTYAIADSGDKLGLIVAFRKAQEDQRKLLAQEHSKREKELDQLAYLSARDPRSLKKAAAAGQDSSDANSFSSLSRSNSVLVDVDGRPQSIRWVESQVDGLDIDIALQHFEDAVSRVEKLRKMARGIKGNQTAQDIIQAKVNERASKLANVVARQLGYESGGQEATQRSVSWLLRLGFEELARTTYLGARTDTIRIRTRSLPFTGALEPYVKALSFTTFTLLLHTFRTFNVSFSSTSGSAVVKWAKERVDEFNATLARQMSSIEKDGELWNACVSIVRENAQALREVGVDFHGIVARGLEEGGVKERHANGAPGVGLGVTT
ncbi:Exocyst complex component exo84 [Cercospora beticola]|uniref:Exocyst complex component EXO84 n=1 Tax=Cercospora beticola TaxID=122368 RepID=A0A2G5H8E2_CERBT|nr:Exocyst complex component exo84 [Cercospora beticola]PIA88804.1 Exocyst complex component exo84 [Cercospora beticola]WPB02911.1 hypothetical protein RHO25_007547 [Cercospora beticola]